MADPFLIYIHVKPYVRKYLTTHFPTSRHNSVTVVDLRADKQLHKLFIEGLDKSPASRITLQHSTYRTCRIAVSVSFDTFQRHGTHLTPQAESKINVTLENRCKNQMLACLSVINMLTGNLARSIQVFYERTGYNEDTWPSDSIRKIWQRETTIPKNSFFNEIIDKFSTFIMEKLSHD